MDVPRLHVDRFDWAAPDRIELAGHWTGVRGVRFVRPTLVLVAGETSRRALARLEDKPWQAGGDGSWTVAFAWEGDRLDAEAAELSVAPGIVVTLPAPGAGAAGAAGPGRSGPGILARAAVAERAARDLAGEREARAALEAAHAEVVRERDALRRERDVLLRDRDRLATERDAAVRERDAAAVTRDRLAREREQLVAERERLRHPVERPEPFHPPGER